MKFRSVPTPASATLHVSAATARHPARRVSAAAARLSARLHATHRLRLAHGCTPSLQDIDEQMPKQMGRWGRDTETYCKEAEAWLQTTLSELASAAAFTKAEHETIVDDDAFPFLDYEDLNKIDGEVGRTLVPGRKCYQYICRIHKQVELVKKVSRTILGLQKEIERKRSSDRTTPRSLASSPVPSQEENQQNDTDITTDDIAMMEVLERVFASP